MLGSLIQVRYRCRVACEPAKREDGLSTVSEQNFYNLFVMAVYRIHPTEDVCISAVRRGHETHLLDRSSSIPNCNSR